MLTGNEKLEVGDSAYWGDIKWEIINVVNKDKIELKKVIDLKYEQKTTLYEKTTFLTHKEWHSHDIKSLKQSKSQEINLQVGDTFKNSKGSLLKIESLYCNDIHVSSKDWNGSGTSHLYKHDIIDRLRSGKYTDYRSVSQQSEEWIPQVGDWVRIIGGHYASHKPNTKSAIFQIESISHNSRLHSKITGIGGWINREDVVKALPHEIPTTMKQWKKEDFYNTKIKVDTPEKSRRFQELMFSLGIYWFDKVKTVTRLDTKYLFIYADSCYLHYSYHKSTMIHHNFKEIFYDEIFNENSNQQQLNQKQNGNKENSNSNDISSTNFSGIRGSQTATAISYRKTSSIASSSGYSGNRINGKSTPTKIGRSEVSFTAISI